MNIQELRQKRAGLIAEMRQISDAVGEGVMSEEQAGQWDSLKGQVDQLGGQLKRAEDLAGLEGSLASQPQTIPMAKREKPADPKIGMSDDEIKAYSIVKAIRAAADGDWSKAGLEKRASEAAADKFKTEPNGFFLPADWTHRSIEQMEVRDLTVGTATAGGHTVSTDLLAQNFIDLLRNRMALNRVGVTTLSGLVGDIAIPRQTGGATGYWLAESGAPTESQQAFDQLTASPKTVGAFTDISRKLLKQSSMDIEMFVQNDLARVLALALDLAGIHGSGASNQPTGLAATNGIGSVAGGTDGAAPTWSNIIELETDVAAANGDEGRLAYLTNALVRGKLKETEKASGTARFVFNEESNTPLNGYPAAISNQVASNLTKGSGTNLSAIFFGNWLDLVVFMWSMIDILVDPYTFSTSGTLRVTALQDADIGVRHAGSFSAMLDAITT